MDDLDELLRRGDLTQAGAMLTSMKSWQVLETMRWLSPHRQALLFRLLSKDAATEVFERLEPAVQTGLIAGMRDDQLIDLVTGLDVEDRVALFDELPAGVAHRLLRDLDGEQREATAVLLGYPAGSVGRRMSVDQIRLEPTMRVADALARVRTSSAQRSSLEMFPVTDPRRRLLGAVDLVTLARAEPSTVVSTLLDPTMPTAHAHDPDEQVARLCLGRRLPGVPVTDAEHRLIGVLTRDDALDITVLADAEDAARAGGAEPLGRPYLATPVLRVVRARITWLLVLAVSAILTVSVLETFEDVLGQAVVLALFIPLLTGIGGNTGSQAASTLTRSLAVADVRPRDLGRVVLREARIGLAMGLLLATLGWLLAAPVYGVDIAVVIGCTLMLVCVMAATVGGAMPLVAKALRVDPAAFSTPFISTFCDATGLLIYFAVAKLVLGL